MQATNNSLEASQGQDRGQRRSMQVANQPALMELRDKLKAEQPAAVYKEVETNKRYSSERYGKKTYVYVVEVKKKEVVLKSNLNDKHSFNKSRAEFDKFFSLDGV